MFLGNFANSIEHCEALIQREFPPIVYNLRPSTVDAPQDSHIGNQDLTDFRLLNVPLSEFLPSSLGAELDDEYLEQMLDTATHVCNKVL